MKPSSLSEKSRAILEAIAAGHTFEQILVQDLAWTYHDIFHAAAEAIEVADQPGGTGKSYEDRMAEIRLAHPKAYQPWSAEEDARLSESRRKGASVNDLAREFQRQASAIRSRFIKLGLS